MLVPACFEMDFHDDVIYEQLVPAHGSQGRLSMYRRNITDVAQPPALWKRFQQALSDEASNAVLAKIIKEDPMLAASVLRSANTASILMRTPVNDVGRAMARLGQSMVRNIVAQHAFSGVHKNHQTPEYSTDSLWKHGMAVSAIAEVIAQYIPHCDRDEAATLGLFHDIGRMGLNVIPEFSVAANLNLAQGHLQYEVDRFACTHIEMGQLLAEHWQLPEKIMQAMAYHHHPAYAELGDIPETIRGEVFAVYLADILAIHFGFTCGDAGIVLPHASFSELLPNISLDELAHDKRIHTELGLIQAMAF
ncbi:MAG: HDOD domain-containing protein [Mariprofundaceae bacterium]|nr:HDOD domain-containing protein [Mariprofundaceae bacterium]